MLIERIEILHISMPLVRRFTTSFGGQSQRDCLILKVHSAGFVGWGECVATNDPGYSYETVETAWHVLSDFLIPRILGRDVSTPGDLAPTLDFVRGHPLAKAGLDMAIWDLAAQSEGISLAEKLAAPYKVGPRQRVEVGVSIGIQPTVADTVTLIEKHLIQGYGRIKLKIAPGLEFRLTSEVRKAFPDISLMLDANSAYTLDDWPLLVALDPFDLLMLEQPLQHDDIYEHSLLKAKLRNPLCLDESIETARDARTAIALKACDIINIKPSRVSGFTEARKIHDLCITAGLPVWCGGMLETGIGRAGQLALASLPGFTLPGDISATERYYRDDIATARYLNQEDSTIDVPSGPGLGIEVDLERLKSVTIRSQVMVE